MSNEETRQRIAYLIEHGGLYDPDNVDNLKKAKRCYSCSAVLTSLIIFGIGYDIWFCMPFAMQLA
mgnify:CR=1 FL=1